MRLAFSFENEPWSAAGVHLFVSCTPGLEGALAQELRELGFKGREVAGGFETQGDAARVERCSRIASRVNEGRLLYQRGYREELGKAPMRETLAAGMLRLAGYTGDEPLWDPMCGSGTLLIEAAMIATCMLPGELGKPSRKAPGLLKGTDLNAGALGVTRRNARRAGVFDALTLERADATKVKPQGPKGLLVANLPYGKRVERLDLAAFTANLKASFAGWRFALLLQGRIDLDVQTEHALNNGGLRCRLCLGLC
jgi:putative N6-adenine-specific DNA methylase